MPTVSVAGSRNWITFLGNMEATYACWPRLTSSQAKSSRWQTMSLQWPVNWRRRNSYTVPFQGLEHLEATAIQVIWPVNQWKSWRFTCHPPGPQFASDLSAFLGGGLRVLMAGELNAKHVELNSRLVTKRGTLLHDYADKNSCLIYGLKTPTIPYNPSATPDVLDNVIMKDPVTPVYLTTCSALSSDHLPILIDMRCRPTFLSPPDRRI